MVKNSYDYDLVVLGSGPGGYVAAIRGAQKGLKTAVVEKDALGGVCLNWGCIPSKALLKNAAMMHEFKRADEFGFKLSEVSFDFQKIIKRSREVADVNSRGVEYLFKKNKIEHIQGTGKLTDPHTITVNDANGKQKKDIKADHIIIATGARARAFPKVDFDGKKIITYKEAMTLSGQPERMIVIGAGAIGVEFAYFYNSFGTEVHLVEMLPHILPVEDSEIAGHLERSFKKQGIKLYTGTRVEKLEKTKQGVKVTLKNGKKGNEISADIALVAIGVQGNVENIGLEELKIKFEKNAIQVNEYYQTNIPHIYAIGDVIGAPWLAHVASHEGIIAVDHMTGNDPHPLNYQNVPGCTYCQPQVASIGLTEEKARGKGYNLKIGRFPFRASGKARAIGETDGLVKLIFDARYGELLGAHILGSEATEMIAELGIAKALETTNYELQHTMHAHPTLSEAVMEAAGDAVGEAIHI
ncbi:MAG: dihydrolipoyl dehydrogenase [Calditrichaeota bacterium]|nr:dihydrolipoyl dehydrogenase [Calditrichota bacterium]RQV99704.1 MAG: dihydrolipoyl dehydrogenase [Calditrichota bacterium]